MHGVLPAGAQSTRVSMAGTRSRFTTRSFCQSHAKDVQSRGCPCARPQDQAEDELNVRF